MPINRDEVRNLLDHIFPYTELTSNIKILAYKNSVGHSIVFQNEPKRTEYCFWLADFDSLLSTSISILNKSKSDSRTSGLNKKIAPDLMLGNPVKYLKTKNFDDVEKIVSWFASYKTSSPRASLGSGYLSNVKIKRAVELYAMKKAEEYYSSHGFTVIDTSATKPYDLCCSKGLVQIHVEVKGTRSDSNSVNLTAGEVEHVWRYMGGNDLFIVKNISVELIAEGYVATDGDIICIKNWRPKREDLFPTQYRYLLPEKT